MLNKQEITVQVPSDAASIYLNATPEERQQIDTKIAIILKSSTRTREEAVAKIQQTMDEISAEAERRGLTPEILESLLKDE
ncbi:unknown protein [Rivularia sp. IAM M-261]|nr:unknown protein [Calothrix sp. PCC 7716]GJD18392.1 unknown protein [Rivularia sp. IAM M-261]